MVVSLIGCIVASGIRVIPELDQPAHVGNGWQFAGCENCTVCVNQEPWYKYCVEPPCGQVTTTKAFNKAA